MPLVYVGLVKSIRNVVMDLDELKLQVALGTVSSEVREEVWRSCDKDVLRILGDCTDVEIRKAVAINKYTPYSTLKKMSTSDPDRIVCDCAWDQIIRRYIRRFKYAPPDMYLRTKSSLNFDDLPPDVIINKQ